MCALALAAVVAGCGGDNNGSGGGGGSTATGGTTSSGGSTGTGGTGGTTSTVDCTVTVSPSADDQTTVQTALIEAKEGDVLCFSEGTFSFNTELDLDANKVTIHGAGKDKTTWDFSKQDVGANGMLIKSDGVIVEGIAVKNTPGDGIRADAVEGITFRDMAVIWDADSSTKNGAYGLYPVGSNKVLIDGCEVKGARDAGVYVGQSTNVLIQNNEVHACVAGIEVENTTDAEVMKNHAYDNTAGILAFNLPNLPVQDGKRANIHDNIVENNNRANFGVAGTTVSKVPFGIGIMLLATDDNEIHANTVNDNNSVGILTVSYLAQIFGAPNDPNYNPYPEGNYIHDNTFSGNGTKPQALIAAAAGGIKPIPDIVWDGCTDANAVDDGHLTNCIGGNKEGAGDATYANADLCGNPSMVSQDTAPVTCMYDPLPPQN
ncbi:MAG: parallel beta-helix domain-containing protein [Polyangiaceae bacterium]